MARPLTKQNVLLTFSKTLRFGSKRRQIRAEIIENGQENYQVFNLKPDRYSLPQSTCTLG